MEKHNWRYRVLFNMKYLKAWKDWKDEISSGNRLFWALSVWNHYQFTVFLILFPLHLLHSVHTSADAPKRWPLKKEKNEGWSKGSAVLDATWPPSRVGSCISCRRNGQKTKTTAFCQFVLLAVQEVPVSPWSSTAPFTWLCWAISPCSEALIPHHHSESLESWLLGWSVKLILISQNTASEREHKSGTEDIRDCSLSPDIFIPFTCGSNGFTVG